MPRAVVDPGGTRPRPAVQNGNDEVQDRAECEKEPKQRLGVVRGAEERMQKVCAFAPLRFGQYESKVEASRPIADDFALASLVRECQ